MKPAPQSRPQPRVYLVQDDQPGASAHTTTLGIGPNSPADRSEQPLPLVRTKPGNPEAEVRLEPGTSFDRAAEELAEEAPLTAWQEPAAPAPPMAASILAPPVAIPSTSEREYDVDLSSLAPPEPTTLRARLGRWVAFLVLAGILAVGVLAIDRGLSQRDELPAEPPANAAPAAQAPTIAAAVPEPEGDPAGLPPPNTSRAAAAEAAAQADWTEGPPSTPAGALGAVESPVDEGIVSPPRIADGTTLSVNSVPDASVFVDGQPFGTTPRRLSVAPGKHEVVFVHPELGRRAVSIEVRAGGASVAAVEF